MLRVIGKIIASLLIIEMGVFKEYYDKK